MHIVCSTDNNYIMPTGIMLTSLLINNKCNVHIHVLCDKLKDEHVNSLKYIVKSFNQKISFYEMSENLFSNFPIKQKYQNNHIQSLSTYYRLYITDVLPTNIDKVIYLDGDIIVRKSLMELWETNLNNYYIGGVPDVCYNEVVHYNHLFYPQNLGYINAGVLIINLKKWREANVTNLFLEFIRRFPDRLYSHDQDVLNYVFREKKVILNLKYNMQNAFFYKIEYNRLSWEFNDQLLIAQKDPVIIHFASTPKPWFIDCIHPYKNEFLYYKSLTIWKKHSLKRYYKSFAILKIIMIRLLIYLKLISPQKDNRNLYIKIK